MKLFDRLKLYIQSLKEKSDVRIDLVDNEKKLRKSFLNALPFWTGAFISGSIAVLYANLFALAESGTHYLFENENKYFFFVLTPLCFVLAWWLVIKYAPMAKGSGIPQVVASIELSTPKKYPLVRSLLSLRIIVIKMLSSIVMVFGGGVVGREGPMIQISAAIFKKINDLLPSWYPKISKRNMIVTGAAAGLASAFNTPLGGIVFAIEELTKTHLNFFKSALLTGVIIAGLTALYFLGPYLFLGYPEMEDLSSLMILIIIPLAILTGFAGNGMGKLIMYIFKKQSGIRKNSHKAIYVAVCGLIIAAAAIFIDGKIFGSGKEVMITPLFTEDKNMAWYVPILRIFGSAISFTTGAAGGVFAPALSSGASIGAVYADWFRLTDSETNLVILCGMTGFLTSLTNSPFTASILVLEMTNSHKVIFYIMMTALVANLFARVVSRKFLYDHLKEECVKNILSGSAKKKQG